MLDNLLLVTRHPGAMEWLQNQGIYPDEVLTHITLSDQIKGRNVVGILPFHFAIQTNVFGRIVIPLELKILPWDEYTCQEMEQYGATIQWYNIHPLSPQEVEEMLRKPPLPDLIRHILERKK